MKVRALSFSLLFSVAALAVAACDDSHRTLISVGAPVTPTATVLALKIVPQSPPVISASGQFCPLAQVFTIGFNLIFVVPTNQPNLFIHAATFQLVDGTTLGGPSVTIPQVQLANMFGSTVVIDKTSLPFTQGFTCVTIQPQAIAAQVVLVDGTGVVTNLSASAAIR
jgi:hypothetical protein